MKTDTTFGQLVKDFFTKHLIARKGVSANTVSAYGLCLKMFLNFTCSQLKKRIDKLVINDLSAKLVLDFLNHLENERENSSRSRNSRLAVLKCFFRFLAEEKPECLFVCQQAKVGAALAGNFGCDQKLFRDQKVQKRQRRRFISK